MVDLSEDGKKYQSSSDIAPKICPGLEIGLERSHHPLEELQGLCPRLEVGRTCLHELLILLKGLRPGLAVLFEGLCIATAL